MFFRPPSDFFALRDNRTQIAGFNRVYNRVINGVIADGDPVSVFPDVGRQYRQGPPRTAWFSLLFYLVALIGGPIELWLRRRRREARPGSLVLAFLWSSVVYVILVSNLLEVGENDRFRLYTDPLVMLLVAALALAWRSRRRQAQSGEEPATPPIKTAT